MENLHKKLKDFKHMMNKQKFTKNLEKMRMVQHVKHIEDNFDALKVY